MRRIKVLVLSHMYPSEICPHSGNFVHTQVTHLLEAGCRIQVISPVPFSPKILWLRPKWKTYGQIPASGTLDGVAVHYPRYVNVPGQWYHGISCFSMYHGIMKDVDAIVNTFKPDIIHAHTATPDGYIGLKLMEKYNLPIVCSLRGSDINVYPHRDRLTMSLTKKVIQFSDQLITVSKALRDAAESIAKPKRNAAVIYNGCSRTRFFSSHDDCRNKYRRKLGIAQREKVLIFVGNLQKTKGVFELITAFFTVAARYRDLRLILVGNGSEYQSIQKLISSSNLGHKVHLLGRQDNHMVPKWLNGSDIFVLPSHHEGLSNAVLEAMACSLPVIATRVGGLPEAVEDGQNGILVNSKDPVSLARAIEYLIGDVVLCRKMGLQGRRLIESRFSWSTNAENTINIYKTLLKTNENRPLL